MNGQLIAVFKVSSNIFVSGSTNTMLAFDHNLFLVYFFPARALDLTQTFSAIINGCEVYRVNYFTVTGRASIVHYKPLVRWSNG